MGRKTSFGFTDRKVTESWSKTHYNYRPLQAEIIMEYFKDGSDFGVQIEYIVENEPRGTARSLSELTTGTVQN